MGTVPSENPGEVRAVLALCRVHAIALLIALSDMSTMACRHLLIKFEGSRNPISRRTNKSTKHVTADAATEELKSYADKIKAEGTTEEGGRAERPYDNPISAAALRRALSA